VNALAGTTLPDRCDASYATLFVVTPARDGGKAQVVKSMYGTPDTVGAAQCAGMVPTNPPAPGGRGPQPAAGAVRQVLSPGRATCP
jgi:hypothetical protein